MSYTFTLQNPADVTRSGSDKAWSGIGNVLSTSSYASAGTCMPGDVCDWISVQVASNTIPALPSVLNLTFQGYETPNSSADAWIVDDYIALGNSSGPLTGNVATVSPFTQSPAYRSYNIPTSGITLANLNAGNVYIWIGLSAPGSAAWYNPANYSFSTSPTSPQRDYGANNDGVTSAGVDTTFTLTVTWIGTGPVPTYAPVDMTPSATIGISIISTNFTGSGSVNDGIGQSESGNMEYPPGDYPTYLNATGTEAVMVPLSGGTGTISNTCTASGTFNTVGTEEVALAAVSLSGTIFTPTAADILINSMGLVAPNTTLGTISGAFGSASFSDFRRIPSGSVRER